MPRCNITKFPTKERTRKIKSPPPDTTTYNEFTLSIIAPEEWGDDELGRKELSGEVYQIIKETQTYLRRKLNKVGLIGHITEVPME